MRNQLGLFRFAHVENIEACRLVADLGRLIRDGERVADDVERVGTHPAVRQFRLHHHFRVARIADVHASEVLGRRLMGEPQDAPPIRCQLHVHAFAHAAEASQFVMGDEPHVPRQGFGRVGAFFHADFLSHV